MHAQPGIKEMPRSGGIDNRRAPVLLDDSGGQDGTPSFASRCPPDPTVCLSWPAQGVGRGGGQTRQDEKKEDKGKGGHAQTDKNREKPCRRERARQALLTALWDGPSSSSAQERHHHICQDLESHVWDVSAHDTEAYIDKIKTLKFNLAKNSLLCQDLMAGTVAASQVLGTVFLDKVAQPRLSRWQASGRPRHC